MARICRRVPAEDLPRLLWVNDSFGLGLIDTLYRANAMQPTHSLYYFQNIYSLPGLHRQDGAITDIEWESYLAEFDAVVVVLTEIALEQQAWGFFEALDTALD